MATNKKHVYLIENGGLHKIGFSNNPRQRTAFVRCADGERTVVHSFACDDCRSVEKKLHDFWVRKRVKGEWFNLDAADVSLFCSLKDCAGTDDLPEEVRSAPACEKGDWGQSGPPVVQLPADVFQAIRGLAAESSRPLTWEIRLALIAWLEAKGKWPPAGTVEED